VPIQAVERTLATIFAADIEGHSRMIGWDAVGTLDLVKAHRTIVDRLIAPVGRPDTTEPGSVPLLRLSGPELSRRAVGPASFLRRSSLSTAFRPKR
jgi:hypothetical protein